MSFANNGWRIHSGRHPRFKENGKKVENSAVGEVRLRLGNPLQCVRLVHQQLYRRGYS
jgi:hypothetical protein